MSDEGKGFFEQLSLWTGFLGGLAALVTSVGALYAGFEAISDFSSDAQDAVPVQQERGIAARIETNSALIDANQKMVDLLVRSQRTSGATVRSAPPTGELERLRNEVSRLAADNKVLMRRVTPVTTERCSPPFSGWVYLGKYEAGGANNKTIDGFDQSPPDQGQTVTASTDMYLRRDKPRFPLYRMAVTVGPEVLKSGTQMVIDEIDNRVGTRNFSWARVRAVDPC